MDNLRVRVCKSLEIGNGGAREKPFKVSEQKPLLMKSGFKGKRLS